MASTRYQKNTTSWEKDLFPKFTRQKTRRQTTESHWNAYCIPKSRPPKTEKIFSARSESWYSLTRKEQAASTSTVSSNWSKSSKKPILIFLFASSATRARWKSKLKAKTGTQIPTDVSKLFMRSGSESFSCTNTGWRIGTWSQTIFWFIREPIKFRISGLQMTRRKWSRFVARLCILLPRFFRSRERSITRRSTFGLWGWFCIICLPKSTLFIPKKEWHCIR